MNNYYGYFPRSEVEDTRFRVVACGYTLVSPGQIYPPNKHPRGHDFTWDQGRILPAFQIVYITDGRGIFESQIQEKYSIVAGDVFLVIPGRWHRYRPDPETGWTEHWVELAGPDLEARLTATGLPAGPPCFHLGPQPALVESFQSLHLQSRAGGAQTAWLRAAYGRLILEQVLLARATGAGTPRDAQWSDQLRVKLAESPHQPVDLARQARRMRTSETRLRRVFKDQTGLTPKRYAQEVRLRAAANLFLGGRTLASIAEELGFSSAFHLSSAFKQVYHQSPKAWRQAMMQETTRPS